VSCNIKSVSADYVVGHVTWLRPRVCKNLTNSLLQCTAWLWAKCLHGQSFTSYLQIICEHFQGNIANSYEHWALLAEQQYCQCGMIMTQTHTAISNFNNKQCGKDSNTHYINYVGFPVVLNFLNHRISHQI